ncbi:hypothetical protein ACHAWF_017538, partial [Thalassiosira exigua]
MFPLRRRRNHDESRESIEQRGVERQYDGCRSCRCHHMAGDRWYALLLDFELAKIQNVPYNIRRVAAALVRTGPHYFVRSCFTIYIYNNINQTSGIVCGPPKRALQELTRENDDWKVSLGLVSGLPKSANKQKMQYTKLETALIFSQTKRGTSARSNMMNSMIRLGYTPTTKRKLQDLMKDISDGKVISNQFWPQAVSKASPTECISIRSATLDRIGMDNIKYCDDSGWYRDAKSNWRSKECNPEDVSRDGRCVKCNVAYRNINSARHPHLFQETTKPKNINSLLPSESAIATAISARLKDINDSMILDDRILAEAAGLMSMKECFAVELATSKVFLVCKECTAHRVCRKRSDNSVFCPTCQLRINHVKQRDKRREENHANRVSPTSTVPWTSLTDSEIKIRAAKANIQRRSRATAIKRMKQKIANHKVEMALSEELLDHMDESLNYARNNKDKLRDSIESSLLELMRDEAKKMGDSDDEDLITEEETKDLVDFVAESMRNHIHKLGLLPISNMQKTSEVKSTTIFLNKWSKMDASEAKRPFSWKTLCEISSHLYQQLGVSIQQQLTVKEESDSIGFMPAVAKHLKTVLSNCSFDKQQQLAAEISSFEWLANVHQIFNATLMNTELFLSWSNINSMVANRETIKANVALGNNKMYLPIDVGDSYTGKKIGPDELIKFHAAREQKVDDVVTKYKQRHTFQYHLPSKAFPPVATSMLNPTMLKYEQESLRRLAARELPKGYLSELLDMDFCKQWIQMSVQSTMGSWFDVLLEDTQTLPDANEFESFCRQVQYKLFQVSVHSISHRNNDDYSFEYAVHQFHRSAEFAEMCLQHLPGRISEFHPGCVVLCLSLARMHTIWLKQALLDTRREHNPALFGTSVTSNLTLTEANSEVNRFLGWSTFSAMSVSFSKDTSDHRKCRKVVSSMILREREMTDEYVNEYYDPNMAMLNRGGLTLINSQFFKWGKKLMCAVRNAYSEDHITQDPQGSFGQAQDK